MPTAPTCLRVDSWGWTTSAPSTAHIFLSTGSSSSPTPPAGWQGTHCQWPTSRRSCTVGLWDGEDGFFYDRILLADGSAVPVRVRSMVAMIPLLAAAVVNEEAIDRTLVTDKIDRKS